MSIAVTEAPPVGDGGGTELFDRISADLAELASRDWASEPAVVQAEAVVRTAELAGQVEALDARVVRPFDQGHDWAADGHRSAAVAVRHGCGQSHGTARARVSRARKLAELEDVTEALLAGEITTDAVRVLLAVDNDDLHDKLVRDQKVLIEAAETLEHVDFVKAVRYWEHLADPDRADRNAGAAHEGRRAHGSRVGDQYRFDGDLPLLPGSEVNAELERLEQVLFDQDWAEARDRLGDAATTADLRRTAAQRRADALVEMARRSAAYTSTDPAPAGRVVLNVHMDWETFCAELARHNGLPFDYPENRICELDDGTPIVPSEALGLALGGEIRRIVFGADGHVLDFGRSRRLFTGGLADAIRARDRRCRMPGCLLPSSKCQVDHVVEHQHGGETSEPNGEALCRFHNLWKTNNLHHYRRLRGWDP